MEIADAAIERMANAESSPFYGGLYLARGMVHLAKGAFDQSIEDSELGIETTPNIGRARHLYARSLIGSGRFNEAYREAMAAIRLQPDPAPFTLVTLGIVRSRIGSNWPTRPGKTGSCGCPSTGPDVND